MSALRIKNLEAIRHGRTICSVSNLQVAHQGRLAVFGPNGSGKSTLLRILAGIEKDFSGECEISVPNGHRTFVHQQPWMFRGTVHSNVRYGQKVTAERLSEIAHRLDITDLLHRNARTLSGGELRRVALARAIAFAPRLLLLDEPLADLDQDASERVVDLLLSLVDVTLVIASPVALPSQLQSNCVQFAAAEVAKT